MATAHTYLNFQGNTEEAFNFYRSVFGGEFTSLVRMGDFGPTSNGQLSEADRDKIMHIGLMIGPNDMLMATDALESMGHEVRFGNNSYVYIEADSAEDAQRLFDGLSQGGKVEMARGHRVGREVRLVHRQVRGAVDDQLHGRRAVRELTPGKSLPAGGARSNRTVSGSDPLSRTRSGPRSAPRRSATTAPAARRRGPQEGAPRPPDGRG